MKPGKACTWHQLTVNPREIVSTSLAHYAIALVSKLGPPALHHQQVISFMRRSGTEPLGAHKARCSYTIKGRTCLCLRTSAISSCW